MCNDVMVITWKPFWSSTQKNQILYNNTYTNTHHRLFRGVTWGDYITQITLHSSWMDFLVRPSTTWKTTAGFVEYSTDNIHQAWSTCTRLMDSFDRKGFILEWSTCHEVYFGRWTEVMTKIYLLDRFQRKIGWFLDFIFHSFINQSSVNTLTYSDLQWVWDL